jgi:uncharacterized protein
MSITLTAIYRYPVKGLTAEPMPSAVLEPGEPLPFDRAWAVENGPGRFNAAQPKHLPKISFLMLMRDERLAAFTSHFDEKESLLTITRAGLTVCQGSLDSRAGRAIIEQFLAAFMDNSLRGPPRIVRAPGHSFSDTRAKCVHVINMASVREMARDMGRPIDPLRFRANLVIDGGVPWAELSWVGKTLRTASGARLEIFKRTARCAATNVDPATGRRDLDIPAVLARRLGHTDFGIYARVIAGGMVTTGDRVSLD